MEHDPDQYVADLRREIDRLRAELAAAEARARTWRRVAQMIHEAQRGDVGGERDSTS